VASALAGPRAGVAAASGAVNAGAVGLTSGLGRPRAVMSISVVALAEAAFLGSVAAPIPAAAVAMLAALSAGAGLLTGAGTIGVRAMVGFVTLGHFPFPPVRTLLLCLLVIGGGSAQILLGLALRADLARRALRSVPVMRDRIAAGPARHHDEPAGEVLREAAAR
jgi:hypothetical protein